MLAKYLVSLNGTKCPFVVTFTDVAFVHLLLFLVAVICAVVVTETSKNNKLKCCARVLLQILKSTCQVFVDHRVIRHDLRNEQQADQHQNYFGDSDKDLRFTAALNSTHGSKLAPTKKARIYLMDTLFF